MQTVPTEHLQRAIAILGEGERRDTEIDIAITRFAPERMTLRRLVDCIPEAFGLVLLPNVADVILPTTFTARAADGTAKEFALEREPIFEDTMRIAREMYANGQRAVFANVTKRSGLVAMVNQALDSGTSLDGVRIPGPTLASVPAEFYDVKPKAATSFWKKLVG